MCISVVVDIQLYFSSGNWYSSFSQRFHIPDTNTIITLNVKLSLNTPELEEFLAVFRDYVKTQIERYGVHGDPGILYEWDMGGNLFRVWHSRLNPLYRLSCDILLDEARSLQLYLMEGERPREAEFEIEQIIGDETVFSGLARLLSVFEDVESKAHL